MVSVNLNHWSRSLLLGGFFFLNHCMYEEQHCIAGLHTAWRRWIGSPEPRGQGNTTSCCGAVPDTLACLLSAQSFHHRSFLLCKGKLVLQHLSQLPSWRSAIVDCWSPPRVMGSFFSSLSGKHDLQWPYDSYVGFFSVSSLPHSMYQFTDGTDLLLKCYIARIRKTLFCVYTVLARRAEKMSRTRSRLWGAHSLHSPVIVESRHRILKMEECYYIY